MPPKLHYLLTSRKFWSTAAALVFILAGPRAGMNQDQLVAAVGTLAAYVIGTALEDGLRGNHEPD